MRARYYTDPDLQALLGIRGEKATNIGTMRQDYLNGPGNAMDLFLQKFTPKWVAQTLADWVNGKNDTDRVLWLWCQLGLQQELSDEAGKEALENNKNSFFACDKDELLPQKVKPEGIIAYLKQRGFLTEGGTPSNTPQGGSPTLR